MNKTKVEWHPYPKEEKTNQEVRKDEDKDVYFKADSGQTTIGHHKQAGSDSVVQMQQLSFLQV